MILLEISELISLFADPEVKEVFNSLDETLIEARGILSTIKGCGLSVRHPRETSVEQDGSRIMITAPFDGNPILATWFDIGYAPVVEDKIPLRPVVVRERQRLKLDDSFFIKKISISVLLSYLDQIIKEEDPYWHT